MGTWILACCVGTLRSWRQLACNNHWEQFLLTWEVLPATALTPVTYSPTLKTSKELGKSGKKNKFLNFGWQAWELSSYREYKNVRGGDQLWLLKHIVLFCKYHSVYDKCSLQRNLSWLYLHLLTNTSFCFSVWRRTARQWVFSGACASIRSAGLRT